ncbi:MAG: uroporphyrinogen-III synthase [Planctomycetaceae bacterium]
MNAAANANRPRVLSFESRRAAEMRTLIEKHGGDARVAPSMREVPLGENAAAFAFADELFAGRIDVVVFMTGVGARTLLDTVETRHDRRAFLDALGRAEIVVRGPKPTAVLREWGVRIDHRVPEPNTWRELLATLDEHVVVDGRMFAVQEYGQPNEELYRALAERGARVLRVPVYRWALPEDVEPLRQAIRDTLAGVVEIMLFTSAEQVRNVLRVAEAEGQRDAWIAAASKCRIASIGPTCSEAIREAGLPVHVEASPPKMGHLVSQALSSR